MVKDSFNVLAFVLIILGLLLILDTYDIVPGVILLWPFIVFMMGVGFCILFYQKKRKDLVLLGLGTFITLCSVFFTYLNSIGWGTLSYLWPVFPGILGASFLPPYYVSRKTSQLVLGVILITLAVIFILVFAISTSLWPVSLVLAGGSFLILGRHSRRK